jgi:hypothetical protein
MTHDTTPPDPGDFHLNGEPASELAILMLDETTLDLLNREGEAQIQKKYFVGTIDGDEVYFETYAFDEEKPDERGGRIALSSAESSDYFCSIHFAPIDQITFKFVDPEHKLKALQLAQSLLESGELDEEETRLIKFVKNAVLVEQEWKDPTLDIFKPEEGAVPEQALAGLVRAKVDEKTSVAVRITEFNAPLPDGSEVVFLKNDIIGELDPEDLHGFPYFQLQLYDRTKGVVYLYSRDHDGKNWLIVQNHSDSDEEIVFFAEGDEDITEEMHRAGYYVPGSEDVKYLSDRLAELKTSLDLQARD